MAGMEARVETTQLPLIGLANRRRRQPHDRSPAQAKAWDPALRHAQIPYDANARLTILYGHPLVSRFGLQAAAERALAGEPVVYLDGAHTFDSFAIGRLAKTRRQPPRKVLAMIHVARAFSAHQMERLISNCLADALERYQARAVVISGLVEALADDDSLSEREIARMSDRALESIRHLTLQGYSVLCPCPVIPMATAPASRLSTGLRALADRCIRVQEVQGTLHVEEEIPLTAEAVST